MNKNLWNFEGLGLKTEEYPHSLLKEYAEGLEIQTNGDIKVNIRNQMLCDGFETYFYVKLKNLSEIRLFKVCSPMQVYPVAIEFDSKSFTQPIYCADAKDFCTKMDELIIDNRVGTILAYYLQLNEINEKK